MLANHTYEFPGPQGFEGRRTIYLAGLVWLLLLALGSMTVSTPFRLVAAHGIPYAGTLYGNGLLIGMMGLLALLTADVFALTGHPTLNAMIVWGSLAALVLGGLGSAFHAWGLLPVGLQITAFVLLGVAVVALAIQLFFLAAETHQVWTWAGAWAAVAAAGGTLAGLAQTWILGLGNWPRGIIGGYASSVHLTPATWLLALNTAYLHEMMAAAISLAVIGFMVAFGRDRAILGWTRFGLWILSFGALATTLVYTVSGFSPANPPLLLQHGPDAVNALAGGDLIVAIGVFLGAAIALFGFSLEGLADGWTRWSPTLLTVLVLITVGGLGSYVDWNTSRYGMGALAAPLGRYAAAFAWFHWDFSVLVIPAVLTWFLAMRVVAPGKEGAQRPSASSALVMLGTGITFVGGLFYLFASPNPEGAAFVVAAVGLAVIAVGIVLGIVATASQRNVRAHPMAKVS